MQLSGDKFMNGLSDCDVQNLASTIIFQYISLLRGDNQRKASKEENDWLLAAAVLRLSLACVVVS